MLFRSINMPNFDSFYSLLTLIAIQISFIHSYNLPNMRRNVPDTAVSTFDTQPIMYTNSNSAPYYTNGIHIHQPIRFDQYAEESVHSLNEEKETPRIAAPICKHKEIVAKDINIKLESFNHFFY